MGLIRVSDDAEKKIKDLASATGGTITTTVDKILQSNDIAARLDKMGAYLKQRLDDLEAALDGAVLSSASSYTSRSSSSSNVRSNPNNANGVYVPWEVLQPLMFDELYEGSEWLPGAEEAARSSDNLDMCSFFVRDGLIVSDDMWGKTSWLKVSPRVKDYLLSHGVEIQ